MNDPLKKCPRGCLFEAKHNYCPWHGEPLRSLVGETIGENFVIERVVSAAGGFGVVYFASNADIEMPAAVKVLRPNACYDENAVRDFLEEAERAYNLLGDCPNTTRVNRVGKRPFPFICMNYIRGGSLYNRLETVRAEVKTADTPAAARRLRVEHLPWQDCFNMLLGVARALEYAHDKEMVHRDLKPHNVLIDKDKITQREVAKVVDWGIAIARRSSSKVADDNSDTVAVPTLTLTAEMTDGMQKRASQITVKYAPPEFFKYVLQRDNPEDRNLKEVFDPRTDIYQFGLVAFELLTGEFPFDAPQGRLTPQERFEHWRQQHCRIGGIAPKKIGDFRSDFSVGARILSPKRKRMRRVIQRCLQRDPKKRFANGEELIKGLTQDPVWEVATRAAAALVLFVGLLLWLIPSGGAPVDAPIFEVAEWKFSNKVAAREIPSAIRVEGQEEPSSLFRIWGRNLAELKSELDVYTSRALNEGNMVGGEVETVSIARCTRRGSKDGKPVLALLEENPKLAGLASSVGSSVQIPFKRLIEHLEEEQRAASSSAARELYFAVTTVAGSGAQKRAYFEIVLDPEPPTVAFEKAVLSCRESGLNQLSYRLVDSPDEQSLYVPEGMTDLRLTFRVTEDQPGSVKVRLQDSEDELPVREFEGVGEGGSASESVEISLATLLGRRPTTSKDGTVTAITLIAEDVTGSPPEKSGSNRGEKKLVLRLDTGMTTADASIKKAPERRASVSFKISEASDGVEAFWRLQDSESLTKAILTSTAGVSKLTADLGDAVLQDGAVAVTLVDPSLIYPGENADTAAIAARLAPAFELGFQPDAPISGEELTLKLGRGASAPKDLSAEADGAYRYITNLRESFPRELIAVAPRSNPAKTVWKVDDVEKSNASTPFVLKLGELAAGIADVSQNVMLQLETVWGARSEFRVELAYNEKLSFYSGRIQMVVEPAKMAPSDDFVTYHAVRVNKLQFRLTPGAVPLSESSKLTALGPVGAEPVTFKTGREGEIWVFKLESGALQDGLYRLLFRLEDKTGNVQEVPRNLFVHGAPPDIETTVNCDDKTSLEPSGNACTPIYTVSDPSGIDLIRIQVGNDLIEWDVATNPKGPARDPAAAGYRVVRTESPQDALPEGTRPGRVKFQIDSAVLAGDEQKVAIEVVDFRDFAVVDGTSRTSSCVSTVSCTPQKPPSVVSWEGLEWIYIDAEPDFYVSKTEISNAYWDPNGAGDDGELPKTRLKPAQIEAWIKERFSEGGVYLPTLGEWQTVARGPGGPRGTFRWLDGEDLKPGASGFVGGRPDELEAFESYAERLKQALVCIESGADAPKPVEFEPPGLREFPERELFFGALHVVGNVQEVVVFDDGVYRAVGGSYKVGVLPSVSGSIVRIFENRAPPPFRGFRLVAYYKDTQVTIGSNRKQSRNRSASFSAAMNAARRNNSE